MVSDREAYLADKIRKLATLILSAVATYFLLRVLYRTAEGTQRLLDPELFAFLAIAVVAVLWVLGTKRVARRAARQAPDAIAREGDDSGE